MAPSTTKLDDIAKPEAEVDDGSMKLKPLGMFTADLKMYMTSYLNAVCSEIKNSFGDLDKMLNQMENGYEAHYMKLEQGGEMKGMVFFNIDHTQQTEFRAYIRHVSVLDKEQFSEAIQAIT